MKRIIVDWNGNTDYLLMLLTFVGCEIKAGKTEGQAHGHNWRMQDDGVSDPEDAEGGTKKEIIDSWSIVMSTEAGKQIAIDPDDISDEISSEVDHLIEKELKYPVTWREHGEEN